MDFTAQSRHGNECNRFMRSEKPVQIGDRSLAQVSCTFAVNRYHISQAFTLIVQQANEESSERTQRMARRDRA
jgi:hypothetical protein